jgi:hypothetical protein
VSAAHQCLPLEDPALHMLIVGILQPSNHGSWEPTCCQHIVAIRVHSRDCAIVSQRGVATACHVKVASHSIGAHIPDDDLLMHQ